MPQRLDILRRDPAEAETIGDLVHIALKPRKAVGERAVEIEDDEGVGQVGIASLCGESDFAELTAKMTGSMDFASLELDIERAPCVTNASK